jgi:hypothetical protein
VRSSIAALGSLLGLFSYERYFIESHGGVPPSRSRMWAELLAGSSVMSAGFALRRKAKVESDARKTPFQAGHGIT